MTFLFAFGFLSPEKGYKMLFTCLWAEGWNTYLYRSSISLRLLAQFVSHVLPTRPRLTPYESPAFHFTKKPQLVYWLKLYCDKVVDIYYIRNTFSSMRTRIGFTKLGTGYLAGDGFDERDITIKYNVL